MSWNKPSSAHQPPPVKSAPPALKRGLLAGLIVVALGALGLYLFSSGEADSRPLHTKDHGRIKEVTPAAAPKPMEEPPPEKPEPEKPKPAPWRTEKLSEEKREALYEKELAKTPLPEASTNRLFRSGLEQVMGWVFTTEVGDLPPPLPMLPDFDYVHLQEILELKNTVTEKDSEKGAATKQIVDFAKKELKAYVEKGGDPQEFLKYYHDELKTAYHERQLAQEEVMKVLRNEPDLADDYVKKVNESLAERGIKPITIPERLRRSVEREMVKELQQAQ